MFITRKNIIDTINYYSDYCDQFKPVGGSAYFESHKDRLKFMIEKQKNILLIVDDFSCFLNETQVPKGLVTQLKQFIDQFKGKTIDEIMQDDELKKIAFLDDEKDKVLCSVESPANIISQPQKRHNTSRERTLDIFETF